MNVQATTAGPHASDPYASRGAQGEVADRHDPVLWGDRPGPLSAAERQQFEQDGYRFIPMLLGGEESRRLREEAERLAHQADPRGTGVITEPGSQVVRSIFRIHRDNELFRNLCSDPRIVEPIRQLLGSDVYVHQSRINYKPAFDGKEFFWHSDFETWHIEDGMPRMRAISMSLFLTESNEFNGPLMVVPGSHQRYVRCAGQTPEDHFKQSLKKQQYGVPSRESLEKLVAQSGIVAPKGPAGSALFFECNTMHGSVGNLSPFPRMNLFVVYNSVENPLVEPFGSMPPRPEFLAERDVHPISQW